MNEEKAYIIAKSIADACFDGHLTLLRFTTHVALMFGPQDQNGYVIGTKNIRRYSTLTEAIAPALQQAMGLPPKGERP